MTVFLRADRAVLFVHIPKAGGSSLEAMMSAGGWQETCSIRGLHASRLCFMRATPQHWSREQMEVVYDFSQFAAIVAIVREPFARLKSEYYWQTHQGLTALAPADWWDHMQTTYRVNPYCYDNHIRPQHEFLPSMADVFKLEDKGIRRAYDALTGRSRWRSMMRSVPQVPELKKSSKSDRIEAEFLPLRPSVEEFYAADYDRLAYRRSVDGALSVPHSRDGNDPTQPDW